MRRPAPSTVAFLAISFVTAVLLSACAPTTKPTEKELATKRWNAARSTVLLSLAKEQYASGQFDKCRKSVDDGMRLVPDSAAFHVLSARLHIEAGQLEAAERELELARKNAPADGEADYLSGVVYQRWQKNDVAYNHYHSAAEKSPAELAYVLAEAEALVALDRITDALALLKVKADYFEHSGTIRDALGQVLMQQGKFVEAAAAFRQASILSEDEPAIREHLAIALYRSGDYKQTADVLARLVQDEPFSKRADLLTILGECQLQMGRSREARFTFETATGLDQYGPLAWRGLGRAAMESGDLKRAELALSKSVKLDPTASETHLIMGYLYLRQANLKAALASFQSARSIDRRDPVALCMAGYVYEKMGQPEMAIRYYAEALRNKPGDELASKLMAGLDDGK